MPSDRREKESPSGGRTGRGHNSDQKTEDHSTDQATKNLLDAALRLADDSNAFIARAMAIKTLATEVRKLQKLTSEQGEEIKWGDAHSKNLVSELDNRRARMNVLERENILHMRDCQRGELLKKIQELEEEKERLRKELEDEKSKRKK